MRVLITGGHLTPALAVIHAFREDMPETSFVFVGREFAQEKELMRAREKEEVEKLGVPFYSLLAPKFHRTYWSRNLKEVVRLFPAVQRARKIVLTTKPDIVLSFGGYLAIPIAIAARMLKVPLITHEQTKSAGLANQVIAKFAQKIALSFEESKRFFPPEKVVVTGNPIRSAFTTLRKKKPSWLDISLNDPLVIVTGGSQGSHIINKTFGEIAEKVIQRCIVVHQCGKATSSQYLHDLENVREVFPIHLRKRYFIREWISEEDMAWLFQHASLVISRSGANTVQEIMLSKVPAIFIPLPFAHNNEQVKNAQEYADSGAALILPQKNLVPKELLEIIRQALRRLVSMRKRAEKKSEETHIDAAKRLMRLCTQIYVDSKKKDSTVATRSVSR